MARPFKCVCDRNPSYFQFVKYHAALRVSKYIDLTFNSKYLSVLVSASVVFVTDISVISIGAPLLHNQYVIVKPHHE